MVDEFASFFALEYRGKDFAITIIIIGHISQLAFLPWPHSLSFGMAWSFVDGFNATTN